jgi:2-keto-4-pentenoate hydratase/2-oxohepta-3-ene-1,7-dioic acid hydratase in catechol pathway
MQPSVTIENSGPAIVPTIYGIGRNYAEHAKELGNSVPIGEPVVFLKAPASLRPLGSGTMAFSGEAFHHEAELVLRIGQTVPVGSKQCGWNVIDAIGLGLDLTRREKQAELKSKGLPWTLAKSFAGAAVVSPLIRLTDCGEKRAFRFKLFINDQLKQSGDTNQMIFDVPTIIDFLASFNTLLPGDLIFTGTPSGVGPISRGDKFTLELEEPHRHWSGTL